MAKADRRANLGQGSRRSLLKWCPKCQRWLRVWPEEQRCVECSGALQASYDEPPARS